MQDKSKRTPASAAAPVVWVRFPRDLLARVDRHAKDLTRERGTPVQRGTAIRELVHAALRDQEQARSKQAA